MGRARERIGDLVAVAIGVWLAALPFVLWVILMPSAGVEVNIQSDYHSELTLCQEQVSVLMNGCPTEKDTGDWWGWVLYAGGGVFLLSAIFLWLWTRREYKEVREIKDAMERIQHERPRPPVPPRPSTPSTPPNRYNLP